MRETGFGPFFYAMCGRFSLSVSHRPDLARLGLQIEDRFNIAPQTAVLVFDEVHEPAMMLWDFSPSWAKTPMHIINARSETLREKPAFRSAKRCVLLADGWYEWQRRDGQKTPWYHHRNGELLYFAGIYAPAQGCAIVTRPAHENIAHVHSRQPVLLEERAVVHWLAGHDLFASAITRSVECHPVSRAVNKPSNDNASLIEPVNLKVDTPRARDLFDS